MGLLDALLGRSKPAPANLDHLFGLSSARLTLEATEGLVPSGQAGVCFKPAVGQAFEQTEREINAMLDVGDASGATVSAKLADAQDQYGYRWIVVGSPDFDELVTRVHFVNSTLKENGYDQALLCSVFGFKAQSAASSSIFLVYLFKRGTFYPFVPTGTEKRDNEAELRLKNEIGGDLSIESDLDRWFPIWDLPVH